MAWKPTIRDIACLAGVSKSTASRVLATNRPAFLFPRPDLPCFHDRFDGYCQALKEAGMRFVIFTSHHCR